MMTLAQQVSVAKKQAEQEIFAAVERLHKETGLCVDYIHVDWLPTGCLNRKDLMELAGVNVDLKG